MVSGPPIDLRGAVPIGGPKANDLPANIFCPMSHADTMPAVDPSTGMPGMMRIPRLHSWAQYMEEAFDVGPEGERRPPRVVPVGFFCTCCLTIMKPTADQIGAALAAGFDGPGATELPGG